MVLGANHDVVIYVEHKAVGCEGGVKECLGPRDDLERLRCGM